jgi:hypothetical protein
MNIKSRDVNPGTLIQERDDGHVAEPKKVSPGKRESLAMILYSRQT